MKAGFLEGLRGKGGGYRLTRNADQISVYDVLKVMEGELAPVACLAEDSRPCSRAGICRTLPLWSGLNEVVSGYLKKYTLQDLVRCEEDC